VRAAVPALLETADRTRRASSGEIPGGTFIREPRRATAPDAVE
jgi:hypothetical protein